MKHKPHLIEVKDMQDWIAKQRIMYARSSEEKKTLYCTLNGSFELEYKGEVIWQGMQAFSAVEAYNDPDLILRQRETLNH